ncbi:MAG: phage major capsid protein [Fimbriimonadaceae bacterium]|nr:phage major capsid protein [Fimbriimonadaceae bacterium]
MLKLKREALRQALEHIKALQAKYTGNQGNFTPDEEESFDKALADAQALQKEIQRLEEAERLTAAVAEPQASTPPIYASQTAAAETPLAQTGAADESRAQMAAFGRFLASGVQNLAAEDLRILRAAHQADSNPGGGYLTAPPQFVAELIRDLDDEVFMRRLGRVIPVTQSGSLGVPTLTADLDDADWTGELTSAADDEMTFGKRELKPNYLSKLVKLSAPLIRRSPMDVPGLVRQRLAYKFGATEEKAFLTGNGVAQPLGVLTASNDGISTSRDTTTAASLAIGADDVIGAFYSLKSQYRRNATWLFHRNALGDLRKLKDSNNNYLWTPFDFNGRMLTGAEPGAILGQAYVVSEFATAKTAGAWVAGDYAMIVGDFRHYWIADVLDTQIQVLTELYALTNQIGYVGRREVDGMPILENAFQRIKIKA